MLAQANIYVKAFRYNFNSLYFIFVSPERDYVITDSVRSM